MHQRAALHAGEHGPIDLLGIRLLAEDDAAARAAERLVRGRGDVVGHRHRVVVQLGGHQPGIMGHVDEQLRPALAGDLGELAVRNLARIGAGPRHDHLRLMLAGQGGHLVEVDALVVLSHAVAEEVIELARKVQLHAVRQVSAVGQVEAQHDVARLQSGEIDGRVGLGAGVGLDVGVLGAEDLLEPVSGEVFGHVDELAAAVIAMGRIAFGIFIRQHAAHRLHDGGAGVVFRGDHFQPVALPADFAGDGGPNFRVLSFDVVHLGCVLMRCCVSCGGIDLRQALIVHKGRRFVNGVWLGRHRPPLMILRMALKIGPLY